MANVEVRVFEARLMLQTTRIAQRFLRQALLEVQKEAQARAATGPYARGRLAGSIYNTGATSIGWKTTGSIGSRKPYAASVESGAGVHDIFPRFGPHVYRFGRAQKPALKFFWRGRVVVANQIPMSPGTIGSSHPGQRGKGYLSKALIDVGLRRNMRVIIYDV